MVSFPKEASVLAISCVLCQRQDLYIAYITLLDVQGIGSQNKATRIQYIALGILTKIAVEHGLQSNDSD